VNGCSINCWGENGGKDLKKNFCHIHISLQPVWYAPANQPPPKMVEANKILANNKIGQVVAKTDRCDKTEIKKSVTKIFETSL
jgi:hypothetical protein